MTEKRQNILEGKRMKKTDSGTGAPEKGEMMTEESIFLNTKSEEEILKGKRKD